MAKLLESTREKVKDWQKYLDEALKAEELVMLLPEEIRDIKGSADTGGKGTLNITINEVLNDGSDGEAAHNIPSLFATIGVYFEEPIFSSYNGTWHRNGSGTLISGNEISICFNLKDTPKNCKLIRHEELCTVVTYTSECEELSETQKG